MEEEDDDVLFVANENKPDRTTFSNKKNLRQFFSPAVKRKTRKLLGKALARCRKEEVLSSPVVIDDDEDFADFKQENVSGTTKPNVRLKTKSTNYITRSRKLKSEKDKVDMPTVSKSAKIAKSSGIGTALKDKEQINDDDKDGVDSGSRSESNTKCCHICNEEVLLTSLKDHLVQCMNAKFGCQNKNSENEAVPVEKMDCPVCGKDLQLFGLQTRTQHINNCIDQGNNRAENEEKHKQLLETARTSTMPCPMCGKKVQTADSRIRHLKKCGLSNDMSLGQVIHLINQQAEEYKDLLDAGVLPQDFRPPAAKQTKITKKPLSSDEDVQLAMALSTSMMEFQTPNVTVEKAALQKHAVPKPRGGKKPKKGETNSLLLSLNKDEASERVSKNVAAVIFNGSPDEHLSKTPSFKNVKNQNVESLWSRTSLAVPSEIPVTASSPAISSSSPSTSSSLLPFYVHALMSAVSVSTIVPGTKLRRCSQIPGRGKSFGPADTGEDVEKNVCQDNEDTTEMVVGSPPSPCGLASPLTQKCSSQTVAILAQLAAENEMDGEVTWSEKTVNGCDEDGIRVNSDCLRDIPVPEDDRKDRSLLDSLSSDLMSMVGNPAYSDVILKVEGEGRIAAHMNILAVRCPQICREIEAQSGGKEVSMLDLRPFSKDSVSCILSFIYGGKVITPAVKDWKEVVELAERFCLNSLLSAVKKSECQVTCKSVDGEMDGDIEDGEMDGDIEDGGLACDIEDGRLACDADLANKDGCDEVLDEMGEDGIVRLKISLSDNEEEKSKEKGGEKVKEREDVDDKEIGDKKVKDGDDKKDDHSDDKIDEDSDDENSKESSDEIEHGVADVPGLIENDKDLATPDLDLSVEIDEERSDAVEGFIGNVASSGSMADLFENVNVSVCQPGVDRNNKEPVVDISMFGERLIDECDDSVIMGDRTNDVDTSGGCTLNMGSCDEAMEGEITDDENRVISGILGIETHDSNEKNSTTGNGLIQREGVKGICENIACGSNEKDSMIKRHLQPELKKSIVEPSVTNSTNCVLLKPHRKGKRVSQREMRGIVSKILETGCLDDEDVDRIKVKVEQLDCRVGQQDLNDSVFYPSVLYDGVDLDPEEINITFEHIAPKHYKKRKRASTLSASSLTKKQKLGESERPVGVSKPSSNNDRVETTLISSILDNDDLPIATHDKELLTNFSKNQSSSRGKSKGLMPGVVNSMFSPLDVSAVMSSESCKVSDDLTERWQRDDTGSKSDQTTGPQTNTNNNSVFFYDSDHDLFVSDDCDDDIDDGACNTTHTTRDEKLKCGDKSIHRIEKPGFFHLRTPESTRIVHRDGGGEQEHCQEPSKTTPRHRESLTRTLVGAISIFSNRNQLPEMDDDDENASNDCTGFNKGAVATNFNSTSHNGEGNLKSRVSQRHMTSQNMDEIRPCWKEQKIENVNRPCSDGAKVLIDDGLIKGDQLCPQKSNFEGSATPSKTTPRHRESLTRTLVDAISSIFSNRNQLPEMDDDDENASNDCTGFNKGAVATNFNSTSHNGEGNLKSRVSQRHMTSQNIDEIRPCWKEQKIENVNRPCSDGAKVLIDDGLVKGDQLCPQKSNFEGSATPKAIDAFTEGMMSCVRQRTIETTKQKAPHSPKSVGSTPRSLPNSVTCQQRFVWSYEPHISYPQTSSTCKSSKISAISSKSNLTSTISSKSNVTSISPAPMQSNVCERGGDIAMLSNSPVYHPTHCQRDEPEPAYQTTRCQRDEPEIQTLPASPLPLRQRLGLANPFGAKTTEENIVLETPANQEMARQESVLEENFPVVESDEVEDLDHLDLESIDNLMCENENTPECFQTSKNPYRDGKKAVSSSSSKSVSSSLKSVPLCEKTPECIKKPRNAKGGNSGNIPSPFTPMPAYNDMNTPDLKKAVQRIGVKPLGKKRMRDLLKHVYEETHQYETDSDYEGTPMKQRHCGIPKETNANILDKGTCRVEGSSSSSDFSSNDDKGKSRRLKSKKGKNLCLPTKVSSTSGSVDEKKDDHGGDEIDNSQDSSYSDGPVVLEESILMGWPEEEEMEAPCTQLTQTSMEVLSDRLMTFLRDNPKIYERILMYEALELDVLKKQISDAGIRIGLARLQDFLDERCITFSMKNMSNRNNRHPPQRKAGMKRNSPLKRKQVSKANKKT